MEIKRLVFEFNNVLAREKLIKDKNAIKDLLRRSGIKSRVYLTTRLNKYGYQKIDGKYIKVEETPKKEVIKTKKIECNMPECNRVFETELDKRGIPIKRRCPLCNIMVNNNKYYRMFR